MDIGLRFAQCEPSKIHQKLKKDPQGLYLISDDVYRARTVGSNAVGDETIDIDALI